jgi:hypothetical protein
MINFLTMDVAGPIIISLRKANKDKVKGELKYKCCCFQMAVIRVIN